LRDLAGRERHSIQLNEPGSLARIFRRFIEYNISGKQYTIEVFVNIIGLV